jgi:hypothetical protein
MSYITRGQKIKTDFSANGQILALDVSQLNFARFEFSGTYTLTGTFETSADSTNGTDGTWFPLQVVMVNAATTALSHSTANATQAYEASVAGVTWVRIRLTAFTSAAAHRIAIFGVDANVEPAPVAQVLGTVTTTEGTKLAGSAISVTTAASTNASSQKATAGNLFELAISNPTATAISVKLYNKATAPTVGTDVPVLTQTVAAGATVPLPFGSQGKRFTTGIAMAATAAAAATDTAVAVAGVQIHGTYI